MKRNSLLAKVVVTIVATMMMGATVVAQTTPTVKLRDGSTIDFTNANADNDTWWQANRLTAADTLTLTGTWNATQLAGLRASIKNSTATDNAVSNSTLVGINMSTVTLTGTFNSAGTGMSSLFRNCTALKTITLPTAGSAERVLFSHTFRNCTSLTSITIPEGFTNVFDFSYTFEGCSLLKSVTLPARGSSSSVFFYNSFSG